MPHGRSWTNWEEGGRGHLGQRSAKQMGKRKLCAGFPGAVMGADCTGSCGRREERAGSTGLLEAPETPLRSLGSVGSPGRLLIRGCDVFEVMV